MDPRRIDAVLSEILYEQKTITGFLEAIFGFLGRNTDFYLNKTNASEKMGLGKGVRERILLDCMQRCDPDYHINLLSTYNPDEVPEAIEEIEIGGDVETIIRQGTADGQPKVPPDNRDRQENSFSSADYKNGALCGNYCWSQTLKDIDVHITLPPDVNNAKLLRIHVKDDNISVTSQKQPLVPILSGQLSGRVKHNDALWTVSGGKLTISFDKVKAIWWEKFLTHEKDIDIKTLDTECFIQDLPMESRAAIQKFRVQE